MDGSETWSFSLNARPVVPAANTIVLVLRHCPKIDRSPPHRDGLALATSFVDS